MKAWLLLPFMLALLVTQAGSAGVERTADEIIRAAVDQWRGVSSQSEMTMVIHRPDWERSMTMRAWTKGDDKALVRVLDPAKDRGNGTLTDKNSMWTFSPKVNRVIKIPSSMMGQSWMGSDFSNKDVAKADDIIDQYTHTLLETHDEDGTVVYEIESVPFEDAAVVWGREVLLIREDNVVAEHRFYDQDGELVKVLESLAIGEMGGRQVALRQRMHKVEASGEWTEIRVLDAEYGVEIPDNFFTLSNLRNPRD
jgi:outer membrane lipoprotein-sorting protein